MRNYFEQLIQNSPGLNVTFMNLQKKMFCLYFFKGTVFCKLNTSNMFLPKSKATFWQKNSDPCL